MTHYYFGINDFFQTIQFFQRNIPILHQNFCTKLSPQSTQAPLTVCAQCSVLIEIIGSSRIISTFKLKLSKLVEGFYLMWANLQDVKTQHIKTNAVIEREMQRKQWFGIDLIAFIQHQKIRLLVRLQLLYKRWVLKKADERSSCILEHFHPPHNLSTPFNHCYLYAWPNRKDEKRIWLALK